MTQQQSKVLIVVPTYNEAPNIITLLDKIFENFPTAHVLFVDDNSVDDTQKLIEFYGKQRQDQTSFEQIFLMKRPSKLGLGTAYIDGFSWGLERQYDLFVEMDADLSHNPAYLPKMISVLRSSSDVAIGSRYIEGGGTQNWGVLRRIISRFGSLYARCLLGIKVNDLTGGFNGWKKEVLATIDLKGIKSEGYSFQIELKYRAFRAGFALSEFPIVFVDRYAGQSKMSSKIVLEAMFRVWQLRFLGGSMVKKRAKCVAGA